MNNDNQKMEKRHCIVLTGAPEDSSRLCEHLADSWSLSAASSLRSAQDALSNPDICVGMVEFDSASPETLLRWHEQLLVMSPSVAWLALVPPGLLEFQEFRDHLAQKFSDFHTKPYDPQRLRYSLGHAHGMCQLRNRSTATPSESGITMVGQSEKIQHIYAGIAKAASVDYPTLITGEIGTGKSTIARMIHEKSNRSKLPFVVIDCSSLSAEALISELTAPTSPITEETADKLGRLSIARGGTVLFDEIAELSLPAQAVLVAALQNGVLCGTKDDCPGIRVIASSQVDLEAAAGTGGFREDLYYRINVLRLVLPPLREREEDILPLADHFLRVLSAEHPTPKTFSSQAREIMETFHWPGNLRGMINRISSALVMGDGSSITPKDLGLERRSPQRSAALDLEEARMMAERNVIVAALRHANYNLTAAAKSLRISRMTMYRMMEKLELSLDRIAYGQKFETSPAKSKVCKRSDSLKAN